MNSSSLPKSLVFGHDALGEIIGVMRGNDVVQFRGVPYADISARFRQSTCRLDLPEQPFDATQPGPICPQTTTLPFPNFWTGPRPIDGIELNQPAPNEFRCLNLNISVPRASLNAKSLIPVLVFIHGGAFMVGSSSIQVSGREIYDGFDLVRSSINIDRPLIVVSINYRVGPLGFLVSKELAAYNNKYNEAVGNYGLHDQRQALEWVYRFISGFGGNPENITIQGGSAGGASCHYQASFATSRFKRAILSSGTMIGLGSMPLAEHQKLFDIFVAKFGHGDDVVSDLQSVSAEVFTKDVIGVFYHPYIDGHWILGTTIGTFPQNKNPPELMIGSCAYEQDLTLSILTSPISKSLNKDQVIRKRISNMVQGLGISSQPSTYYSHTLLSAYGLSTSVDMPSGRLDRWAEYLADLLFRIPPYLIALNHSGSKVFVYDFQGTNPFPGWELGYGKANHAISDIFLFNPAGDLVERKHHKEYDGAVRQLQAAWIKFCYGILDWEPFNVEDSQDLGPIHTIANESLGRKYKTLRELVREDILQRWKAVLAIAET